MIAVPARVAPALVQRVETLRYRCHAHRLARHVRRRHLADLNHLFQKVRVSEQPVDLLRLVVLGLEQEEADLEVDVRRPRVRVKLF